MMWNVNTSLIGDYCGELAVRAELCKCAPLWNESVIPGRFQSDEDGPGLTPLFNAVMDRARTESFDLAGKEMMETTLLGHTLIVLKDGRIFWLSKEELSNGAYKVISFAYEMFSGFPAICGRYKSEDQYESIEKEAEIASTLGGAEGTLPFIAVNLTNKYFLAPLYRYNLYNFVEKIRRLCTPLPLLSFYQLSLKFITGMIHIHSKGVIVGDQAMRNMPFCTGM